MQIRFDLAAKRADAAADTSGLSPAQMNPLTHTTVNTSGLKHELAAAVYALYGLTPEETCPRIGRRVKIVDDATK